MLYIVLSLYTIVMSWFYSKAKKIGDSILLYKIVNGLWFFLMIIPSICVAGFRYGISVDYHKIYETAFEHILHGQNIDELEWGFVWFTKLISHITPETWFLFFIYSAITIVLFFLSFKNSYNYFLSVWLFFGLGIYFDTFNGIRQYVVVAVFLYCYRYIESGEMCKYLVIMGLCSLIHTSALITIPIFFLKKVKFNLKYVVTGVLLVLLFSDKLYNVVLYIVQLIPKYNMYIVRNTLANQISFSTSGFIMALVGFFPCIFVQDDMQSTREGKFLYNIVVLGLLLAVSSSFLPFAERLLYYTKAYLIIAIPYSCGLIRKKRGKICGYAISIGLSMMTVIGMYSMDWYAVLPYVSVFSKR